MTAADTLATITTEFQRYADTAAAELKAAKTLADDTYRRALEAEAAVRDLHTRLATAERREERYRLALRMFLDERDEGDGGNAATLETLSLIHELLEEGDRD